MISFSTPKKIKEISIKIILQTQFQLIFHAILTNDTFFMRKLYLRNDTFYEEIISKEGYLFYEEIIFESKCICFVTICAQFLDIMSNESIPVTNMLKYSSIWTFLIVYNEIFEL